MTLPDGYSDVADGRLAAVVTYLEMLSRPERLAPPAPAGMGVRPVPRPDPSWYRDVFRAVGQDWLWFSRLRMSDEELEAILGADVDVYALEHEGKDKGLLELDRREFPDIELAYFGVTGDLIGKGAGRFMMDFAIERAWAMAPRRFWVHTCTLDHSRALEFYIRAGFAPYKRAIEVAPDPRLTGDLPRTAAPQVPLIG